MIRLGYGRDVFETASAKMLERRMVAEGKAANLREEVVRKNPRVLEIERKMSQSAIKIAKAVLDGGDTTKAVEKIKHENLSLQSELASILSREGRGAINFEPKYCCNKCDDTGYTQTSVCNCFEQLLREEAYSKISYAGNMKDASFDTLKLSYYPDEIDSNTGVSIRERMRDVITYCKSYAADFSEKSPSLLLYGPTGVGKTHISLAVAKEIVFKGYGAIYGPVQTLFHQIEKERFGRAGTAAGNTEGSLIESDLLILDDLGTEFSSAFYNSTFYNIINSRILDSKPTIISTNLSQRELLERYGEQITSRIIGTFVPLRFSGKDIRQIKLRKSIE